MRFASIGLCVVLAAGAAACGGDGGNDVTPTLIPGGGVSSGAIDGEVNVFVISGEDDSPIAGATVRVAASTSEPGETGTTDSAGLVTITGVSGPQVITVTVTGREAATWIGVNGANVTIPLASTTPTDPPSATVSGTIEGWDTLPAPAMDHYRVALVLYTATNDLGDPANSIDTPGTPPPNICAFIPGIAEGPCDWELNVRTGPMAIYAIVIDADSQGTLELGDDTGVVEGFAIKRGFDLSDGMMVSGEALTMVDAADLVDVTVAFPAAPSGLDELAATPALQLGDEGTAQLFIVTLAGGVPVFTDERTNNMLPALSGELADGSWDFLVGAGNGVVNDGIQPQSISWVRGADIMQTITFPAFQATPSNVTALSGTYSFTPANGAVMHTAEFISQGDLMDPDDDVTAWNVALLDGSTSFTLPAISPDPLPAGDVTLLVNAFNAAGFDPTDFEVQSLIDSLAALSSNTTDFTH
jgi:hypothetical protein